MNFKQLTKLLNETNEKLFQSAVKAVNTSLTIRNWLFLLHCRISAEWRGQGRIR